MKILTENKKKTTIELTNPSGRFSTKRLKAMAKRLNCRNDRFAFQFVGNRLKHGQTLAVYEITFYQDLS